MQSLWWKWGVKILVENVQWLSVNQKIFKLFQLIHAIPKSWKLAVLNDKGNCKNIYLNHHLIKNNQILEMGKLQKNCTLYLLFCKMKFLRPKNIFPTFFPIFRLNGKRFIFYHGKFQLTPIYICSNIKYWTIFYILINSFLFLIKKILNCVLTVDYKMKQSHFCGM